MLAIHFNNSLSLQDQYSLASKARTKLMRCAKDAQKANKEYNLRVLVGHANLLDRITENVERMNLIKRQQQNVADDLQLSKQNSNVVEGYTHAGEVSAQNKTSTSDYYYYSSESESESESDYESETEAQGDFTFKVDESIDCKENTEVVDSEVSVAEECNYVVGAGAHYAGHNDSSNKHFTTIWEEPSEGDNTTEEKTEICLSSSITSTGNDCDEKAKDYKETTDVCSGSDSDEHSLNSPLDDNDAFESYDDICKSSNDYGVHYHKNHDNYFNIPQHKTLV